MKIYLLLISNAPNNAPWPVFATATIEGFAQAQKMRDQWALLFRDRVHLVYNGWAWNTEPHLSTRYMCATVQEIDTTGEGFANELRAMMNYHERINALGIDDNG